MACLTMIARAPPPPPLFAPVLVPGYGTSIIKDAIANELRSEYRDKCKVALGTEDPHFRPRSPSASVLPSDDLLLQDSNNAMWRGGEASRQGLLAETPGKIRPQEHGQRQGKQPRSSTTITTVGIGPANNNGSTTTAVTATTTTTTTTTMRAPCSQTIETAARSSGEGGGEGEGNTAIPRSFGRGLSKRALTTLSPPTLAVVASSAASSSTARRGKTKL